MGNFVPNTEHGHLFLRLYDSVIRCLNQAAEDFERNSFGTGRLALRQASEILRELDAGVDLSSGRQTNADLHRIYQFLIEQISQAETKRDPIVLREITGLLKELQQSWKAITC